MTQPLEGTSKSRWIPASEIAEAFGVTRMTVYTWARTGKLPLLRTPSGRSLFLRAEIEELIESNWVPVEDAP